MLIIAYIISFIISSIISYILLCCTVCSPVPNTSQSSTFFSSNNLGSKKAKVGHRCASQPISPWFILHVMFFLNPLGCSHKSSNSHQQLQNHLHISFIHKTLIRIRESFFNGSHASSSLLEEAFANTKSA